MAVLRRTNGEHDMLGDPRKMTTMAERNFFVRIRIGVPPGGLGQRHTQITAWLDENCGADGWAMTPSGTRGVLNDALSIYFADAALGNPFVARWCVGGRSRRPVASSRCARMNWSRELGRGCTGPHERRDPRWNAERVRVEIGDA